MEILRDVWIWCICLMLNCWKFGGVPSSSFWKRSIIGRVKGACDTSNFRLRYLCNSLSPAVFTILCEEWSMEINVEKSAIINDINSLAIRDDDKLICAH